jgi:hypothetical protein
MGKVQEAMENKSKAKGSRAKSTGTKIKLYLVHFKNAQFKAK